MGSLVEEFSVEHNLRHRVLGASRGGQVLDIITCCQQALEIGRDNQDQAAVGQMDIRTYHDRIDRSQILTSLLRRGVTLPWCLAALRTQRCPQVSLKVKGVLTPAIQRCKGAMTGSRLAAVFGRILVEDAFMRADTVISRYHFHFGNLHISPFAWSDNIVVITKSVRAAAKSLKGIADALWETGELDIKDGSVEIVPASTRRYTWHPMAMGTMSFDIVERTRCLGYALTCNGDTSITRDRMLGALRGALCRNNEWLSKSYVPPFLKARWWKQQVAGSIGWIAPFVIPCRALFTKLQVLSNKGARLVGGLPTRSNSSDQLTHIKSQFNICLPSTFCKLLVNRIAHVFRHSELPVSSVLSLPGGRLDVLRNRGRLTELSANRRSAWEVLRMFGLGSEDPPSSGRPGIRGESGCVFRWGEGWFVEIRDGLGWNVPRKDAAQTDRRVQILMELWMRRRPQLPFMLGDGPPVLLELENGIN